MLPAIIRAEVKRLGVLFRGETVTEVIVCHHDKAVLGHKFGEGGVAHAIFRHAVRDL